ncbi:MAG: NB-ARC domain-containing protein [Cyanobacteria bacterium J06631_2]
MVKRRALLIGVPKYQSNAIKDLPIVINDLSYLRDSLVASDFDVTTIGGDISENTGRSSILQHLRNACRKTKGVETLLLYFSGHGIHYGGKDYLLPSDADIIDPDYLEDYLVSTELGLVLDQCHAQTILFVIDACREGVKLDAKSIGLNQWSRGERKKASKRSLLLIFACGSGQYSQYVSGDEGFSLFTRAFAEILNPNHPACQVETILQASQLRLDELTLEYQKAPQKIKVAYESTVDDRQLYSRIICEGKLPKLKNSLESFEKKTLLNVPFQVPSLPPYYVDRPNTRSRIKKALIIEEENRPGTLVVSAIYGLGGIGKSVLASALAFDEEVQNKFSDGVLWATLGQQPGILAHLHNWIQELGDYDYKPTTIEATSTHLRSLLRNKSMLLVVDDAWTAEAVEPFRVGGNRCRILVTTREVQVAGASKVDLEQMTPDEAVVLLESYLKVDLTATDRQLALKFSGAVGYLPLALELAAAQIQDGIEWKELLLAFEEEIARLEILDAPDLDDATTERSRKKRSLKASFNLSLKRLKPKVLKQFSMMGVLPEDVAIGASAMTTIWNVSLQETKQTLRELRRRSFLLDGVSKSGEAKYRMHDLMHDTAQSLLQESVGLVEAHKLLCDLYRKKAEHWWNVPNDDYIHANLTWHFEQAQLNNEIHNLLKANNEYQKNAWFEACDSLGQPALFVQDVARGLKLARSVWRENPELSIILQVRYVLITTTLNSLASNLPPELMARLVKEGLWSIEQSWAYMKQIKSESRQAKSIELLLSYLTPDLKEQAISHSM